MVMYHLQTQRLGLKDRIQFPEERLGVSRKVRSLVMERLRGNVDSGVLARWQEVGKPEALVFATKIDEGYAGTRFDVPCRQHLTFTS